MATTHNVVHDLADLMKLDFDGTNANFEGAGFLKKLAAVLLERELHLDRAGLVLRSFILGMVANLHPSGAGSRLGIAASFLCLMGATDIHFVPVLKHSEAEYFASYFVFRLEIIYPPTCVLYSWIWKMHWQETGLQNHWLNLLWQIWSLWPFGRTEKC